MLPTGVGYRNLFHTDVDFKRPTFCLSATLSRCPRAMMVSIISSFLLSASFSLWLRLISICSTA
ncbi:hypothetical protein INR49_019992 [Caranx melampygus]|nr:hypothetical protein INR49_019992 [Caranx melampygus]